jgi:RNA polymerase sigma-70 factor (ECF subfamily)
MLYRVARRMTASSDEAEDLVQQTLIKAYRGWAKFDGAYLRSWLMRIMRNELAYAKRREAAGIQTAELNDDAGGDNGLWDAVAWRDQAQRVFQELEGLPEEYRMAVLLCDVEEMSYEEAARAMEVPIGTVRSRVSRGRALIRSRLTGEVTARDGSAI